MHPKEILTQLGASPLKQLSQNFLTSPHWVDKLVGTFLEGPIPDIYWEIGPGLGALSEKLIATATKPVELFEFDKKLSEYLRTRFPETPLIQGDFLKADWSRLAGRKVAILSNLPYHLSSPMLFLLAEHADSLTHFLFTFQKEYADRLAASPGSKDYGALTLVIALHFEWERLGVLPAGAFYPPPTVASEAMIFRPRPADPERTGLIPFIKAAFHQRRKLLSSNLRAYNAKIDWTQTLTEAGLDPKARAEVLSLDDFRTLYRQAQKLK